VGTNRSAPSAPARIRTPAKARPASGLRRPGGHEILAGIFGILFIAFVIVGSRAIRPPANATLQLNGISSLRLTGADTADFSAYAQRLNLDSPNGQVDIALPLPPSQCEKLASDLGGTCGPPGVTVRTSLTATWDTPELVSLATVRRGDIGFAVTAGDSLGMAIDVSGAIPRLCLTGSLDRAKLTLGPSATPVTITTRGGDLPLACGGLLLHVVSSNPAGHSTLFFDRIGSASARLIGSQMTVRASDETVTLSPGGQTVSVSGPIYVASEKPFTLTATTAETPGKLMTATDVRAPRATSLMTGDTQHIPSLWDREAQLMGFILAPISGLVGFGATWLTLKAVQRLRFGNGRRAAARRAKR
jgi:hypothetical protein